MADKTFDLIILGAGPGGYVAAIRAAQNSTFAPLGFSSLSVSQTG